MSKLSNGDTLPSLMELTLRQCNHHSCWLRWRDHLGCLAHGHFHCLIHHHSLAGLSHVDWHRSYLGASSTISLID